MQSLISVEKAAEVLGISPMTVRLYVRKGKLNPVRIGRRVLLEPGELERFIAAARSEAKRNEPCSDSAKIQ
jgi:excisionase family DNA binding protein